MTDRVVPGRVPRLSPRLTDLLLAVATALVAVASVTVSGEPDSRSPDVLAFGLAASLGGILLLRRRWPMAVLVCSVALLQAYHVLGYPAIGMTVLAVAFYTVAVRGHMGWGVAVGVAVLAQEFLWRALFDPEPLLEVAVSGLWPTTMIVAVLLLGDTVRSRRALAVETAERLAAAEREREREAERRVAEERLRISRELHDVVAHTVTAIGVQARVLADSIDEHPDHARAALDAIRTAIGEAMSQLRATVGVLRRDRDEPLAPIPSLAGLGGLIEAAGGDVSVSTRVDGEPRPLPPTVDLTAYRIIQESLTNVVRHANATEAAVTLCYRPDVLVVEVTDNGDGRSGASTGGHGLVGMAERARAIDGRLVAESGAQGGFRVVARLPIGATS
jgi:MYXO-CTERM domain-containing protein